MYGGGIEFVKKRLSVIDEDAERAQRLIDEALAQSE